MSMQVLTRNYEHNETRRSATPDHATSHAITSAMLRATGIVLLMSLAAIHVVQLVPTFQQSPLLGVAYVFLIAAAVVVGARWSKVTSLSFSSGFQSPPLGWRCSSVTRSPGC